MEELKDLLNQRNLKATPARLQILSLVQNYDGAVPFGEIQSHLGELDRTTIFRTINALLQNGLIHKTQFGNAETYFAMCPKTCSEQGHQHQHVHFKCTNCEVVSCEDLSSNPRIEIPNFQIDKVDIILTGVCNRCLVVQVSVN
ncbi:Fur family transcriptional regulator [Portibacter lacus]|uniref:Fur family transcriptional regulator n=1 Tax=Portibacter lacus TaxID=1099794 RepID=A0AA37WD33_9BACT|nr:transcriptional repressor [Portibacter lacus]GLR15432.1 Fur family transcriptional regulator [Portibacter lacus]